MEETMNNEMEVTTEVSEFEGTNQETVSYETSSGPSKGFVALVVGGIAAVAVGAAVAIKRHKKKKADAQVKKEIEEDDDLEVVDMDDEDLDETPAEKVEETKKPAKEK